MKVEKSWTGKEVWSNIESPPVHYNLTSTSDEDTVDSTDYLSPSHPFADSPLESINSSTPLSPCDSTAWTNRREEYTTSAARKFGFVPSTKLSQSLMKVANSGRAEVDDINLSLSNERNLYLDKDIDLSISVDEHHSRDAFNVGNKAFVGVSQMLCVLKQYVEKSR